MKYVAFVCGHNSGRSQMAQAAFNELKKNDPAIDEAYEAISWGTGIGSQVNPVIIEPMKELGIDVTDESVYFPKDENHPLVTERYDDVVRVYTMGCMDNECVLPKGKKVDDDWDLDDPADAATDPVAVRNDIVQRVLELFEELKV